jgi:hypothetical protein
MTYIFVSIMYLENKMTYIFVSIMYFEIKYDIFNTWVVLMSILKKSNGFTNPLSIIL